MRISSSFLLVLLCMLANSGKVNSQGKKKSKNEEFSTQFSQLQKTTTVFFVKNSKSPLVDSIRQAISAVWDITPFVFADIDSVANYVSNPVYSYFIIKGYTKTSRGSGPDFSNTHFYLSLGLFKDLDKKGNANTIELCRIELYPNSGVIDIEYEKKKKTPAEEKVYRERAFYNLRPILLKAQLAIVSTNLKNHVRPWIFTNTEADDLSLILAKDTLYVPRSVLPKYNFFTGREQDPKDFFAEYKYKYRICSDSELYEIFETQKRGRLLFEYVQSSTDKFITVYDLKEKNIAYKKYSPLKYQLKEVILKRLNRKNLYS